MARIYQNANKEFEEKYKTQIQGIAKYNNVDMLVAGEMFKTNLANNNGTYKGGGNTASGQWEQMQNDYNDLKDKAYEDIKTRKTTTDISGQKVDLETLIAPATATVEEVKKK